MVLRLKELDLSTHEALVYVTLLVHPNITASVLCKETGIPDSKIYYALDGLSKRGMVVVQRGNPQVYLPVSPREAVASLKSQLVEELEEKIKEADGRARVLVDMLMPVYESAEKSEELEVAYIIRGQRNIINRMRALVETARREVTVFISYREVLEGLRKSLVEAREKRGVELNIAMTEEVFDEEACSDLGDVRLLRCSSEQSVDSLGMLISDMKTLLTVSDWMDEAALLTQDRNLIRIAKDYFDSPSCCTSVSTPARRKVS
jgi:sugar-specific transcriptional regulator TrmB